MSDPPKTDSSEETDPANNSPTENHKQSLVNENSNVIPPNGVKKDSFNKVDSNVTKKDSLNNENSNGTQHNGTKKDSLTNENSNGTQHNGTKKDSLTNGNSNVIIQRNSKTSIGDKEGKVNAAFVQEQDGKNYQSVGDAKKEARPQQRKVKKFNLREEMTIDRKLVSMKIAMFCFHGGAFCFLPYITLHMKQLGLTNVEIGYIYAIFPIPSILGPLVNGVLADKLNAFKVVFLANLVLMMVLTTSLIYVPPAPSGLGVTFHCDSAGSNLRWTHGGLPANSNPGLQEVKDYDIHLKDCTSTCDGKFPNTNFCFEKLAEAHCNVTNATQNLEISAKIGLAKNWLASISLDEASHSFASHSPHPHLHNVTHAGIPYDSLKCSTPEGCPVQCSTEKLVDNAKPESHQFKATFWVYLLMRMASQFCLASAFSMMDAVSVSVIEKEGGDYGKQRIMSMLALGVMPLLASYMVDYISGDGSVDYAPAFYVGDALLVIAFIVTSFIRIERPKSSSDGVIKDLKQLVRRPEVIIFFFVMLMLGSNFGFLESFFFVYLKELKAPTSLLGWTLTFGSFIGLPCMFLADRIIEKVGRTNIFILSFMAYSVRFFGYSIITNPWYSFPFETLEIITVQLMWVAALIYIPILAPPSLLATMSGTTGTVHYNVGRGVGSLVGGNLIAAYNTRVTFRIFGVISFVGGVLYIIMKYSYLNRREKSENKCVSPVQTEEKGIDNKGVVVA